MDRFPRIALVHDYLVQDGGAERVLATLQEMFPEAPTYVLLHDASREHPPLRHTEIRTSFLHRFPLASRFYQWYMPLMPIAAEHLDFSNFDLVISSSSSFAKGIIVPPETIHVCYCHTPTRFLWQERIGYLSDLPQPKLVRTFLPPFLHRLRGWDRLAAERPTHMLTNSRTSQRRIERYYHRPATVIHPPVDIEKIPLSQKSGTFWLAGGRLVGYKRFDLIVQAFADLNLPLKIFGIGPEERKLRRLAGARTEFLGYVDDAKKHELYQEAIAFISPQVEDFGITAVEAMAAGKPILAYRSGGATETVVPGVTGDFFHTQSVEALRQAILDFHPEHYDPSTIRAHTERFSKERFMNEFKTFLEGVEMK